MCWVEDFVQGKMSWMVYIVEWYHRLLCATSLMTNYGLPASWQIVYNNLLYTKKLHFCQYFCRCRLFFLLYTLPCWNVQSRWSPFVSWMPWKPLLWTWGTLLYTMQQHNWVFAKSITNLPHKETVYAQWLLWNTHSVRFQQSGNLRDSYVLA